MRKGNRAQLESSSRSTKPRVLSSAAADTSKIDSIIYMPISSIAFASKNNNWDFFTQESHQVKCVLEFKMTRSFDRYILNLIKEKFAESSLLKFLTECQYFK